METQRDQDETCYHNFIKLNHRQEQCEFCDLTIAIDDPGEKEYEKFLRSKIE